MEKAEILARLKGAIASFPDVKAWEADPNGSVDTLAAVGALLKHYDHNTAVKYGIKLDSLGIELIRGATLTGLRTILASAIAELTLVVDPVKSQVYGPGASFDFYRDFRKLLVTAKQAIFFVDPYVNDEFFNLYLEALEPHVQCRMLINAGKSSKNIPAIAAKVRAQRGPNFDLRTAAADIHDRIVFIDDNQCWVIGQSVKDAAVSKNTYLAPLTADVVPEKRGHYEKVWASGAKV